MGSFRSITLWLIIFIGFILIFLQLNPKDKPEKITIIKFFELAQNGQLDKVVDKDGRIEGTYFIEKGGDKKQRFVTKYLDSQGAKVLEVMMQNNVVQYDPERQSTMLQQVLFSLIIPILFFVVLWVLIMRQIQGTGSKAMAFGKSKAKLVQKGQVKVTFADVAGVDEAKEELTEIVDFLKDPKKYTRLGAKIPKGVLLYGAPGTGKTLLAKAVAGEADVPFFSISGSDFVEMFVGVGASRVRDLFDQAKKAKPCLIFIDEIDAVGRHRFAGIGGGHDEREQTLNQLLVELDGFNQNEGIIVIAATNRPDVLDPALLRPGRFDRQITVDLPDVRGREKILEVHVAKKKLAPDVNLAVLARGTPGFSGADLANMVNEAALLAARKNKKWIEQQDFEEAKDRVMMGPERRSLVLDEAEKKVTAVHEAGHALAAHFEPEADPVHKVTIVPRGRSLGTTHILPDNERHNKTKKQLQAILVYALGGLTAEEIVFGEFTTGAANDMERATNLAHRMVCEFGMSERLGYRSYGDNKPVFLGKDMVHERNYSEETARIIDEEVKKLIDEAHARARQILTTNRDTLERVADVLIERETITGEELKMIIEGRSLPPLFPENGTPAAPGGSEESSVPASGADVPVPAPANIGNIRPGQIPTH
ncbi:MAG: ATP-dependent zinc metalloprotease FtsH [Candidatus Sumerlaeia bacterium]